MKRFLPILMVFIACNTKPSPSTETKVEPTDNIARDPVTLRPIRMTNYDSCKLLHERITYYIEQADIKAISEKNANKKIDSLQKILFLLRNELNLNERTQLNNYAKQLVSDMVDRKVARDNQ